MKKTILILIPILIAAAAAAFFFLKPEPSFGYAREVSPEEAALRKQFTDTAESWLNANQGDGSHKPIIDIYNSHEPLAVGYKVTYTDQWCATFVSTIAIQCGLTGIIPTECGCQRQIQLFRQIDRWQEDDTYVPLPGDVIYFCMNNPDIGECTAWSDHVGIVLGTSQNQILVIEGNNGGCVKRRVINANNIHIRGFATPDYASVIQE